MVSSASPACAPIASTVLCWMSISASALISILDDPAGFADHVMPRGVLARLLGLIHREVGAVQQFFNVAGWCQVGDDADAERDIEARDCRTQRRANLGGHDFSRSRIGFGEQHRE